MIDLKLRFWISLNTEVHCVLSSSLVADEFSILENEEAAEPGEILCSNVNSASNHSVLNDVVLMNSENIDLLPTREMGPNSSQEIGCLTTQLAKKGDQLSKVISSNEIEDTVQEPYQEAPIPSLVTTSEETRDFTLPVDSCYHGSIGYYCYHGHGETKGKA